MRFSPLNRPVSYRADQQRGVVLLVVLILLLLTTLVAYSVMETSTMEAKMAVSRQGREISFQAAESQIQVAMNDGTMVADSYSAALSGGAPPSETFNFDYDDNLAGTVQMTYEAEIVALGSDLVMGNSGLRSLHFQLRSNAGRGDDKFDSIHIQGVKRFAPKLP